jgi:hypothetical protein
MRGPPEVPPAFVADIPFLSCRRLLSAFFTSTAKGRHRRCGNGYCRLKLALATLRSAAVKFLPCYGTFCFASFCLPSRGALFAFIFYRDVSCAPPTAGRPTSRGPAHRAPPRAPTPRPVTPPPPGGPPPPRRAGHGAAPALRYAERGHRRPYGAAVTVFRMKGPAATSSARKNLQNMANSAAVNRLNRRLSNNITAITISAENHYSAIL